MNLGYELDSKWEQKSYISDSLKIRYALHKKNKSQQSENYLFVIAGRGEFIEKYNLLPERINVPEKTTVVLVEHRGQGASEGFSFHVSSYKKYCQDLQRLIEILDAKKYSFMACSMGSLISIYGIQKGFFNPQHILLISPLFSLPKKKSWFISVYCLLTLIHYLGFSKKRMRSYNFGDTFEENYLTNSRDHFHNLKNNLYELSDGTVSWIRATFRAIFYINQNSHIRKSKNKLEILLATDERVVSNHAIYRWIKKQQEQNDKSQINLHFFKTKHEILFDQREETNKVFKTINAWLKKLS